MLNYSSIRHQLHQLAEPSGEEKRSQAFILETLQALCPSEVHTFDNSRNLLAVYDSGQDGPTLLFRGDFDAVRVPETIDVPYASQTPGVSHKCGHDGHATILLGLAEQLHQHPLLKGKVLLFSKPARRLARGPDNCSKRAFWNSIVPTRSMPCTTFRARPWARSSAKSRVLPARSSAATSRCTATRRTLPSR